MLNNNKTSKIFTRVGSQRKSLTDPLLLSQHIMRCYKNQRENKLIIVDYNRNICYNSPVVFRKLNKNYVSTIRTYNVPHIELVQ